MRDLSRKASIFTIVFIVALVIVVFGLVATNVKKGDYDIKTDIVEDKESMQESQRTAANSAEAAAAFMASCYGSTYDIAGNPDYQFGGIAGNAGYWIRYAGVSSPSFYDMKSIVEERITNEFSQRLSGTDYAGQDIDYVTVNVEEVLASLGQYDNGFEASWGISAVQDSDTVDVNNWRFWRLYRVIHDWASEDCFTGLTCLKMPLINAVGGPATTDCILPLWQDDEIVDNISTYCTAQLQSRFLDPDIQCEYEILCQNVSSGLKSDGNIKPCPSLGPVKVYTWSCASGACEITDSELIMCEAECTTADGCTYMESVSNTTADVGDYETDSCNDGVPRGENSSVSCANNCYDADGNPTPDNCGSPVTGIDSVCPSGSCCTFAQHHNITYQVAVRCTDSRYEQQVEESDTAPLTWEILVHVNLNNDNDQIVPVCDYPRDCDDNPCAPIDADGDGQMDDPPNEMCCACGAGGGGGGGCVGEDCGDDTGGTGDPGLGIPPA
ncbi:hypothetical protein JW968_05160 [Candidatus Woesearchaeota archaeon]|nr:hypothetical protein [Candidatus Woesearchaeota archaeon]